MAVIEYLGWLKRVTDKITYGNVLEMVHEEIKVNRIQYGKRTRPEEFIAICQRCHGAISRC